MARRVNVHHYYHRTGRNASSGRGFWTFLAVAVVVGSLIKFWFVWVPALVLWALFYAIKAVAKADQADVQARAKAAEKTAQQAAQRARFLDPHDAPDSVLEDTVMHTLSPNVTESILTGLKKPPKSA